MRVLQLMEKMMSMSDEVWARHANPLSVYTRFTVLPLLSLSIYSSNWFGLYCLIPVSLSLFWAWYNPRAFAPPQYTNNWASKGTFGERIYLRKAQVAIPSHHLVMARWLIFLSAVGTLLFVVSLAMNDPLLIVCANLTVVLPKAWFVDRMVWLYEDMVDTDPEFQGWLRT